MRHFLRLLTALILISVSSCKKPVEVVPEPIPHNKALSWIKNLGGPEYDMAYSIIQLPGGEYAMAGATRSSGGDVPGSRVGYDAWLTKVDNAGNKSWSVAFGGSNDDYTMGVTNTTDGGYLMVGYTFNQVQNKAWAIKTDGNGGLQWQKDLSASNDAIPASVLAVGDGTYVVVGYETGATNGRNGWIAKLDESGKVLWSKSFGGAAEDQIAAVVKTTDGGFAVAGYTKSTNELIQVNKGGFDGWVMKLDAGGNHLWTKTFGGAREDLFKSLVQTKDGGLLAVGHSQSNDGDLSLNNGGFDEFVVKMDGSGNKQWVKTFGGSNEEYITNVVNTNDGGYLTVGYTNSTNGDVTRTNGDFGGWLIKMDSEGKKTATSTYGDRQDDFTNLLINTQDGGYLMGGHTFIENRGFDAWLVKIDNI